MIGRFGYTLPMRKGILALLAGLLLGVGVTAQGTLSEQVLRLLTRDNTWSGVNTYANTVGLTLQSGNLAPSTTTNRMYNVGGNLFFNGTLVATSAGAGTVTSVGLSAPAIFSVANSPVTSAGTLAVTLATQTANLLWAGPASGGAAAPTFRALVDLDVPDTITIAGTNNVTWASVSKSGSSLADLATTSATALTSGTLPDARFPATLPATSGVNLTALNASSLASGTVACARLPALTGDVTTSAGACATTLANTAVTPAAYGDATHTLTATVDSKGRLTALASVAISGLVGVANPSVNTGDTLYASAANVLSALPAVATGNVLRSGGVSTAPAWGKVTLTTDVTGTLPAANGGTAVTGTPSNGQLLIGNGAGYTLAALTGTANQITVTNGAGTSTLSLPQAIATGSTPQWARIGLGTGAGGSATLTTNGQMDLGFINDGNCGAADTIDWNAGEIHKSTLSAATCTYTFSNPIAGRTYVLDVIQDATGSRLVTWPTIKWEGGTTPTLTTTVNKIDRCTFQYDGTSYLGQCSLNY